MWAQQIVGSLNKVFTQFKNTWGYALSVLNYRQVHGQWQSVTWSGEQVTTTAIVTPIKGGSIEITDIIFNALKVSAGIVVISVSDGTNSETLMSVLLTNEAVRMTHSVQGRMQGWRDATVNYTVAGANSTGSITIGYVKHDVASTEDYSVWNSRR